MSYEHAYDLEKAALERKLAAKDAEIAELIAQLDSARQDGEAADRLRATFLRERDEARQANANLSGRMSQCVLQRDEARECVRRLCADLHQIAAIKNLEFGHDYDEIDEARCLANEALAATPEHLR